MIPTLMIEKLRHLPIEQVAEALGMPVAHHATYCPFHQDHHPSLHFWRGHDTYKCFVCDAHGGNIDLVMKRTGLAFQEACRWLARQFGLYIYEEESSRSPSGQPPLAPFAPPPEEPPVVDTEYLCKLVWPPRLHAEARRFLFEERRLSEAVVGWLRLSSISQPMPCSRYGRAFYDAPSLLIPYYGMDGSLLSVQSRYLGDAQADGKPRFRFPKGSQCHIYNLPVLGLLAPGEPLFVTEGCSDCWAMMSMGRKAIAIPSATLLKPSDIEPLAGLNLHICPDADGPGERLYLQLRDLLPQIVHHQLPEGYKDVADWWMKNNRS